MKQKLTVTVLLAALVLTLAPVSARADWVKTSGGTKYEKGGSYVTGFAEIDGSYYYFDMNGIMQTGIVKMSDGSLYCFDSKTGEMILNLLMEMHERYNVTLIIVTHDNDVAALAERTIKIKDGQIIEDKYNY